MIYNYRCSHDPCRKRVTLKHPIEWYVSEPKCKNCGRRQLKFDPEVARRHRRETCRCSGVHFPHRRGTVLGAYEFCHGLTIEAVALKLIHWDGIEPEGPFSYVGHDLDQPTLGASETS